MSTGRYARKRAAKVARELILERDYADLAERAGELGLPIDRQLNTALSDRRIRTYAELQMIADGSPIDWVISFAKWPEPVSFRGARAWLHASNPVGVPVGAVMQAMKAASAFELSMTRLTAAMQGYTPPATFLDEVTEVGSPGPSPITLRGGSPQPRNAGVGRHSQGNRQQRRNRRRTR